MYYITYSIIYHITLYYTLHYVALHIIYSLFIIHIIFMYVFQGVSNLVGDAVASKRSFVDIIPVIGINCWGALKNNAHLIHDMVSFFTPTHS